MDHFYQDIPGWCDFADLYADVVASLPDGAHIVEVGVWQGQSTAALGVEILNSGKVIRLDVVDHFKGSSECVTLVDQRSIFEANVAPIRHAVRDIHEEKSWDAARRYADGSLDFVFLDAAHDTASVLKDLAAWWPKIKPGGSIAGHDADWPSVTAALKPWSELSGVRVDQVSRRSWRVKKAAQLPASTWTVPPAQRKCLVAVCSNERSVYRQTAQSLLTLGWGQRVLDAIRSHGFTDVQVTWVSKFVLVSDLRNEAARLAIAMECSHVLFLDADMVWPSDVLSRMLAHHDKGIVSGLYFLKSWPHYPVALTRARVNAETLQVDYDYDKSCHLAEGVRPVDLVGMGCTMVPVALFHSMAQPWFEYQQDGSGNWSVTEDVAFCQKAKALGCPILLDPDVKCGHVAQHAIAEPWYERSLSEIAMLDRMARTEPEGVAV